MTTGQVAEAAQKKQGEQNVDSANTVDFVKNNYKNCCL